MKKGLIIPILILLVLFNNCKSKDDQQSAHSPFHNAISAFTSGQISAGSSVVIEFTSPPKGAEPGQEVEDILRISPSVEGKTVWAGDRTLVFKPAEKLPSGTEYKVKVNLPSVMPKEKDPFHFTFRTIPQEAWLSTMNIGPVSLSESSTYRSEIKLTLADIANKEEVRKNISVDYQGKPITPDITRLDNRHYLIATSGHERGEKQRELEFHIKKGPLSPNEEKSLKKIIPAKDEFKILSTKKESAPQNVITITFSDPIAPDQDISGLFRLGDTDMDWNIDNNRVHLYPGENTRGEIELLVLPEVRNAKGKSLRTAGKFQFSFSSEKPQVEIVGDGTVIPYSEGLYMPFRAVSLNAVRVRVIKIYEHNIGHFLQTNRLSGSSGLKRAGRLVHRQRIKLNNDPTLDPGQWNTFSLDLSKFIQPDPGAIYRVEMGFEKQDANYTCVGEQNNNNEKQNDEQELDLEETDGDFWDTPNRYYSTAPHSRPENYSWRDRDNPCAASYYTRDKWISKNVLASNLGLMVKGGKNGSYHATATDLRSTEPLKGVEVELYNLQMVKIGKGQTNAEGSAIIQTEGTPFLMIAKDGKQRGYLRMDEGRTLPIDRFDVSGETVKKGLKGFIFGERGVWRPGDSIFISFMPMETEKGSLPPNHPVTFELINPRGKQIEKQLSTHPKNRLYTFRTKTAEDAQTGYWMARVTMGGVVFNKQLRIETIRPNRLKTTLKFPGNLLQSGEMTRFEINAEWLHGSPASELKTDVRMNVSHNTTQFESFRSYQFDDPAIGPENQEIMLYEGRLDDKGHTSFTDELPRFRQAPGILTARFTTRVFEKSGAFSSSSTRARISPFDVYTGIKTPKGNDRGRLLTDEDHQINLVTVNNKGEAVGNQKLKYTIYKLDWRWWWEKSEENLGRYISSNSREVINRGTVKTRQNGKATFNFKIEKPEWGRYLIHVVNMESGHATGDIVMVDWPGWSRESKDTGGASLLSFKTDRNSYQPGDDITVTFPSSEQGRARVSIETGSSVLKSWWVEPEKEETSFTFEATEEMTPNIYISITLIQPHAQTANNRPIRLYGVVPVSIENPETHLNPQIETIENWRPDKRATIKVSEANNSEMEYVVAVVDEGLLDLTNFSTPDPWRRFNAREALGVKTWDLYDEVVGAFGGKIEQLFSIGGDGQLSNKGKASQIRRFEPMVRFIGPYRLKKKGKNNHIIDVPSYTGSVRVMVIATNGRATGSHDTTVKVKNPVMVWSSLPRMVSPKEKLSLPVSVFVTEKNINKVTVSLECSEHYKITGKDQKVLSFDKPGEKNVLFDVKTTDQTGPSQIIVKAEGNGEKAELTTNLKVRMPNPPVAKSLSTVIKPNEDDILKYNLPGIKGTNTVILEASTVPPMNLTDRLNFLIRYPHGCIEQITSAAFPQLYIDDLVELTDDQKNEMHNNINRVLEKLLSYQTSEGGFAYWPGRPHVNEWGSNYAGHFMLEAEKQGYVVNPSVKSNWLASQKRLANAWMPESDGKQAGSQQMSQAYRLYTLALAGHSPMGAMNRLRQQDNIIVQARWLLASAYTISGMHEVANEIMDNTSRPEKLKVQKRTYGSPLRDKAILVNALNLLDRRETAMPIVRDMAGQLNSDGWYSTQTTAWALMSIVKFSGGKHDDRMQFSYHHNRETPVTRGTDKPLSQHKLKADGHLQGQIKLSNECNREIFFSLVMSGTPADIDSTRTSENLGMQTSFLTMDNQNLSVNDIKQGTDFKYVVRVNNPGTAGDARNLALTQMVPSGWEIRNTRLEGTNSHEQDLPDYRNIRDDRVYSYFDLKAGESKAFVVVVHAAFAGTFYLPPVSCEAMYNHRIKARVPGQMTQISRP